MKRPSIIRYLISTIIVLFILVAGIDCFIIINTYQDRKTFYEQTFITTSNSLVLSLNRLFDNSFSAILQTGYDGAFQRYLLNNSSNPALSPYLQSKITSAKEQISNCRGIFLYSQSNHSSVCSEDTISQEYQKLFADVVENYSDEITNFNASVSDIYYAGNDKHAMVFFIFPINCILSGSNDNEQFIGAVLIDLTQWIDEQLQSRDGMEKLVVFQNGSYIGSHKQFYPNPSPAFSDIPAGRSTTQNGGHTYLTFRSSAAPYTQLGIIYFYSEDLLLTQVVRSMIPIFICQLLFTGAFFLLTILLIHFYRSTINGVSIEMQRVKLGEPMSDSAYPFVYKEFQAFPSIINAMIQRLESEQKEKIENQKRLYDTMIAQKQAELIAYRNQINPHFLINTLTFIQNSAQLRQDHNSVDLISHLSSMFRYALYSPYIVDLDTEIEHLQSYFAVINIRFPNKYAFQVNVTDEASEWLVLSMLLQPLLENSIRHGADNIHSQILIELNAYIENEILFIYFKDNGAGISSQKLKEITSGLSHPDSHSGQRESITLKNIYHRIKLLYGAAADFTIQSEEGEWTEITLKLPHLDDSTIETLYKISSTR